MGAYAVPSNKAFITDKPLKMKRKRGRIDDLMEMIKGTHIETDPQTGNLMLMRGSEIVGVFHDEDDPPDTEKHFDKIPVDEV